MEIKDGVFIVTGSATGLGAAVAQRLAAKGGNVVINYTRSEAEAQDAAEACRNVGGDAILCQADVSVDADCRRMAEAALERWGRIDGLVNNAATSVIVPHYDLEGLSSEDFRRVLDVNVIGAFQMVRAVTPAMQEQGNGAIVNVSSGSGFSGSGSSIAYAASKAALNVMTYSLARALAPEIRVNAVCPGVSRRDADSLVARGPRRGKLPGVHRPLCCIRASGIRRHTRNGVGAGGLAPLRARST